jgi:hypothetical protein
MTGLSSSIMPRYYEMWNDGSSEFAKVVKRMLRLGYKVSVIPIERDHQQSQLLGTKSNTDETRF